MPTNDNDFLIPYEEEMALVDYSTAKSMNYGRKEIHNSNDYSATYALKDRGSYILSDKYDTSQWGDREWEATANLVDFLHNTESLAALPLYDDELYRLSREFESTTGANVKAITGVSTASMERERFCLQITSTISNGALELAELAKDVVTGAVEAVSEVLPFTDEAAIKEGLAPIKRFDFTGYGIHTVAQTKTEEILFPIVRTVTELVAGFKIAKGVGATKAIQKASVEKIAETSPKLAKFVSATTNATVAGAIADTISVEDENLMNVIQSIYKGDNPYLVTILEALATNEDDSLLMQKLKNIGVNAVLGLALDGVFEGLIAGKNLIKGLTVGNKPVGIGSRAAALADDALPPGAGERIVNSEAIQSAEKAANKIVKTYDALHSKEGVVTSRAVYENMDDAELSALLDEGVAEFKNMQPVGDLVEGEIRKNANQSAEGVIQGAKVTSNRPRNNRITVNVANTDAAGNIVEFVYRLDGDAEKIKKLDIRLSQAEEANEIITGDSVAAMAKEEGVKVSLSIPDYTVRDMQRIAETVSTLPPKEAMEVLQQMLLRQRGVAIQSNVVSSHTLLKDYKNFYEIAEGLNIQEEQAKIFYSMLAYNAAATVDLAAVKQSMPAVRRFLRKVDNLDDLQSMYEVTTTLTKDLLNFAKNLGRYNQIKSGTGFTLQGAKISFSATDVAQAAARMTREGFQQSIEKADSNFTRIFNEQIQQFLSDVSTASPDEFAALVSKRGNREMLEEFFDALGDMEVKDLARASKKLNPSLMKSFLDLRVSNVLSTVSVGTVLLSGVSMWIQMGLARGIHALYRAGIERSLDPLTKYAAEARMFVYAIPHSITNFTQRFGKHAVNELKRGDKSALAKTVTSLDTVAVATQKAVLDGNAMIAMETDTLSSTYLLQALAAKGGVFRSVSNKLSNSKAAVSIIDGIGGLQKIPFTALSMADQLMKYPPWHSLVMGDLLDAGRGMGLRGKELVDFVGNNLIAARYLNDRGVLPPGVTGDTATLIVSSVTHATTETRRLTMSLKFNETDGLRKTWSGWFARLGKRAAGVKFLTMFPQLIANMASTVSNSIPIGFRGTDELGNHYLRGTQAFKDMQSPDKRVRESAAGRIIGAYIVGMGAVTAYNADEGSPLKVLGALSKARITNPLTLTSFMVKVPDGFGGEMFLDFQRNDPPVAYVGLFIAAQQIIETAIAYGQDLIGLDEAFAEIFNFVSASILDKYYMESIAFIGKLMQGKASFEDWKRTLINPMAPLGGIIRSLGTIGNTESTYKDLPPAWSEEETKLYERAVMVINQMYDLTLGKKHLHPVPRLDAYGKPMRNTNFVLAETLAKNATGLSKIFAETAIRFSGIQMADPEKFSDIRLFEDYLTANGKRPVVNEFLGNDMVPYKNEIFALMAEYGVEEKMSAIVKSTLERGWKLGAGGVFVNEQGVTFPAEAIAAELAAMYSDYLKEAQTTVFLRHKLTPIDSSMLPQKGVGNPVIAREQMASAIRLGKSVGIDVTDTAGFTGHEPQALGFNPWENNETRVKAVAAYLEGVSARTQRNINQMLPTDATPMLELPTTWSNFREVYNADLGTTYTPMSEVYDALPAGWSGDIQADAINSYIGSDWR